MKCPNCNEDKNITVIKHLYKGDKWTAPCKCNSCNYKFTYPDDCDVITVSQRVENMKNNKDVKDKKVQGSLF